MENLYTENAALEAKLKEAGMALPTRTPGGPGQGTLPGPPAVPCGRAPPPRQTCPSTERPVAVLPPRHEGAVQHTRRRVWPHTPPGIRARPASAPSVVPPVGMAAGRDLRGPATGTGHHAGPLGGCCVLGQRQGDARRAVRG